MNNETVVHWWQGYVIVKVKGKRLERLINRMMNQRLTAWDIQRVSESDARISITIQDYYRLRQLLKETGCRAYILHKVGFPFFMLKMRKRSGFVTGGLLFLGVLYMLSMMIWTVEIEGVALPEDELKVEEALEEMGVSPWSFKFRAEGYESIKQKIMETLPQVTWVGFEYRGTQAYVEIVEKKLPEMDEPTSNRHLVAKKKAVIHDLFVEEGQPAVEPNEYVEPGDVLISGYMGAEDEIELLSAKGEVWGEVWYETEMTLPLSREYWVLTGEERKKYELDVGPYSLTLWGWSEVPYEHYMEEEREYGYQWRDWSFPVSLTKTSYRQSKKMQRDLSEEQALKEAQQLSAQKLRQSLDEDAKIEDENILKKRMENGKVYIKMHFTVIEEISTEEFIYRGD